MARWGLCSGCVFGVLALGAVGTAMWWLDGAAGWIGWGVFTVFGWCAAMSVYSFDRPAPRQVPRARRARGRNQTEHGFQVKRGAEE